MPKNALTILTILSLSLFSIGSANADWLDKLKDTAKELTDKAGEIIEEATPAAPSTSDGEGQVNKPATPAAPSKPATPKAKTVATPTAPTGSAVTGNNDKTLVMATQKELKRLGYKIGVDGAYGPTTKKRIIAFQKTQSITATGNASPELLATLKATPTPKAEPATATAASAPAPKAEAPKAEPVPAPKSEEPKAEPAAAVATPKKSLNPADYDRAYAYEGGAPELEGKWLLIKDRMPERFYAEIKGDEITIQKNLQSMKPSPGFEKKASGTGIVRVAREYFAKTPEKDPPAVVLVRFGNTVITAKVISNGSHKVLLGAKGPDVTALLAHVKSGGNFEFRVDKFEPFLYGEDWTTFSSPPPEIAAAKLAAKEKQAAAQAAAKAEQEKKAAYAGTLTPESKLAYEQCEQNNSARTFYSCQCIAENIESYLGPQIDEQAKYWKQRIDGYEGAIKKNNANPKLTAEKKAQSEQNMRQQIERAKAEIAKIEDRANWDNSIQQSMVQSAALHLYKEPTCKTAEGMRKKEYGACMKSSSFSKIKGKTQEEYCSCSADKAAELWLNSPQAYSSKVAVSIPVQARTYCRK